MQIRAKGIVYGFGHATATITEGENGIVGRISAEPSAFEDELSRAIEKEGIPGEYYNPTPRGTMAYAMQAIEYYFFRDDADIQVDGKIDDTYQFDPDVVY